MGQVLTYPATGGHQADDVLMVESGCEQFLCEDIAAGIVVKPHRCFAVTEDNINRYGYTLAKYLSYACGRNVTPSFQDKQSEQILFFEKWECFIAAFNARTLGNYLNASINVSETQNNFFPNYDALTTLLKSFTNTVVNPLLELSPFIGREFDKKPYLWFPENVNWIGELKKNEAQWDEFKTKHMIYNCAAIDKLASYARSHRIAWEKFNLFNATQRCFDFSSYLYGLAEAQYSLGNYVISLVCLHRATDLYLQYLGLDAGVIYQSAASGLEYDPSYSSERISIINSIKVLEGVNRIRLNTSRLQTLLNINEDRNKLIITHSVYGITPATLLGHLDFIEKLIVSIEGSTKWSQTRKKWFPLPVIKPDIIFDLENSIKTYINEVSLP